MSVDDRSLIEAVKGLAACFEKMQRTDDCVRLTPEQAHRLAELAERGYYAT